VLVRLELDRRGIREFLQGPEVHRMVNGAVQDITARVRARLPAGVPVNVREYTTDRGAASITIADVRGMAWQARDGVLTRAAGEAGIEVRAWGSR
jgi:hypothetical protein